MDANANKPELGLPAGRTCRFDGKDWDLVGVAPKDGPGLSSLVFAFKDESLYECDGKYLLIERPAGIMSLADKPPTTKYLTRHEAAEWCFTYNIDLPQATGSDVLRNIRTAESSVLNEGDRASEKQNPVELMRAAFPQLAIDDEIEGLIVKIAADKKLSDLTTKHPGRVNAYDLHLKAKRHPKYLRALAEYERRLSVNSAEN